MPKLKIGDKIPSYIETLNCIIEISETGKKPVIVNNRNYIIKDIKYSNKHNELYYYHEKKDYKNDLFYMTKVDELDALIQDEFILPENWHVITTEENIEILSEWYGNDLEIDKIVGIVLWDDGRLEKGWNLRNLIKGSTYDFGREITFEQFEKYVLKKEDMSNKEIIGYKLNGKVTPEQVGNLLGCSTNERDGLFFYGNNLRSSYAGEAKRLGILDLWFEPVYKEEFKIGDWITITDSDNYYSGRTVEIIKPSKNTQIDYYNVNIPHNSEGGYNVHKIYIRKATKSEIEKAQAKIFKVGDFEVIVKKNKAFHNCDDITNFVKEMVISYSDEYYYGGYWANVKEVVFSKTGCQHSESKLSEWKEVYDAIKNN